MSTIPKKVLERFARTVPKFQSILKTARDRDVNESDTVSIITDILAEVFGYDKYVDITSEFAVRGTYCDLAVKVEDKVHLLIEAKAVGIALRESHLRQALDYGANHGIQWVILTTAVEWKLFRIRFEQPINYDLVCSIDLLAVNPKDERDCELLFLLAKEGLARNAKEEYFEKVQSVNRFVIGAIILGEPVISMVRRELRRFSDGVRVDAEEVASIIQGEVLKRELVEGDEATAARARVEKFYRKASPTRRAKSNDGATPGVPQGGGVTAKEQVTQPRPLEDCDRSLSDASPGRPVQGEGAGS